MTKANNYTKPAENLPAIELSIRYDIWLSQMNFEENIEILQHSGYKTNCIAFYHGQGEVMPDDITFTIEGKKSDMQNALIEYFDPTWIDIKEIKRLNKAECINDILELIEHVTLLNWHDVQEELSPYNLKVKPSHNILSYETRGYSQGDYALVYYVVGDYEPTHIWIDHLFWDCPISGMITIDGEEYYIDEILDDPYEYDKDAIVNHFDDPYIKEWLADNLPEYPDYV